MSSGIVLFKNFNQETAQQMFTLLLFISVAAEDISAKVDIAKATAKSHNSEMLFVIINTDEEDHKSIMDFFDFDESELPSMRIIELDRTCPSQSSQNYTRRTSTSS